MSKRMPNSTAQSFQNFECKGITDTLQAHFQNKIRETESCVALGLLCVFNGAVLNRAGIKLFYGMQEIIFAV